jgi:hypothetical protein
MRNVHLGLGLHRLRLPFTLPDSLHISNYRKDCRTQYNLRLQPLLSRKAVGPADRCVYLSGSGMQRQTKWSTPQYYHFQSVFSLLSATQSGRVQTDLAYGDYIQTGPPSILMLFYQQRTFQTATPQM